MTESVTPSAIGAHRRGGIATGALAMVFVGSSVAVSSKLGHAPIFTTQAIRYAAACVLLLVMARSRGRDIVRPRGTDWVWLTGISATGLTLFNLALVRGAEHAEPAVFGVAVASVPVLLALVGPLLDRRPPATLVVAAALVVTAGAALVEGSGRTDLAGIGWALVVLTCEAAFTLLALPVLPRLGAWSVSVFTTAIAVVMLASLGGALEGPGAIGRITGAELFAAGYLAVSVTAIAFVLWFSAVDKLGPGRAGLLTGVAPVAAAGCGVLLGGPAPHTLVWVGIGVVTGGLALGLRSPAALVAAAASTAGPSPQPTDFSSPADSMPQHF